MCGNSCLLIDMDIYDLCLERLLSFLFISMKTTMEIFLLKKGVFKLLEFLMDGDTKLADWKCVTI